MVRFSRKYPQRVLSSAEFAEMAAPKAPQTTHPSCSKDITSLKEPCINKNGTLLAYEAFLWEPLD